MTSEDSKSDGEARRRSASEETELIIQEEVVTRPVILQPTLKEGTVIDGRYELVDEIGRGGMGKVYRGIHLKLNVPIAVKVMLPEVAANIEYARRFRREARAMSRLQHRNVAQVHDFGDMGGVPYMVIEFLRGESLASYLKRIPIPPLRELAAILLEIIDGLEAAHSQGIVHRDLKPDNIFLASESDGRRVVKVLDFGLARVVDTSEADATITQAGLIAGTPQYMSPEQCRSMDVGPGADIYSLGCILTEMLQGQPPFHGVAHADVLSRHLLFSPPPLERSLTEEPVPSALEKLRLDLLAKTPNLRPHTMARVRTRFLDAMRSSSILPGNSEVRGGANRESRAPKWTGAQTPTLVPLSQSPSLRAGRAFQTLSFIHWEAFPTDEQIGWKLGLELHDWSVHFQSSTDAIPAERLVVIDCADTIERAIEWLDEHPDVASRSVVCGRHLVPVLPRLIATGVGDVLSYPVDATALARKLTRLVLEAMQAETERPDEDPHPSN